ncbi:endonuclease/exonuclease/phosphatase family protein [Bergeriella denitrificans]|uniref:Uncharacterized protein conserved in bacteria n=1 Tax=Bergeriella denitrificans TaxID=494 RepID=A0A378UGZ0_BERDE|nr:endonuclease/exonuclease/phosphatase family protein [Bergeriella denitrificans]STZ76567.1 Uncharacterized protein conserved in bacteria [Bergeriella denitrificans]
MNPTVYYTALCFLALPLMTTLLPLVKHDHWLFRVWDFPRLQIAVAALVCIPLAAILAWQAPAFGVLALINALCLAYQLWHISAYTRLSKPTVLRYCGESDERSISLLTSNVLTPNRQSDKLLAQIRTYRPDVVLTLETDLWWQEKLDTLEQSGYVHNVKVPLDNLYGMHLYSRLQLDDVQVRHWVAPDIPSIAARLQLRSGEWVRIYCLHPQPPSPTEAATATDRDAELLLVGQEIAKTDEPVFVFGDLNDVAWSSTSTLFQKISGLLDPRKGRGMFSTFHAHYRLLRWPLDHIFHSHHFMMRDIRVLPDIGSDHFPVYGAFQYHPAATALQDEPVADREDKQEAAEKIADSDPIKEIIDHPDNSR